MASFYDTTIGQQVEFQRVLASAGFTDADVARIIKDATLASKMYEAIRPLVPVINWTPVDQYANKLWEWQQRFDLGFTAQYIAAILADLPDHAGPHQPTSVSVTLGKGLMSDREVVQRIIAYEMSLRGHKYTDYVAKNRWAVNYYPGCEPNTSLEPQLAPALLDIGRFWDPKNGVTIAGVRKQLIAAGEPLPTLEVDWLMALNPQVLAAIDYKVIPGFIAPGLVVDFGHAPGFRRDDSEAYAHDYWDGHTWSDYSVVAFREC